MQPKELQAVQSTQDERKSQAKVLAIGPIGVGKTTQIQTLPGKKFVYAFDPNCLDSLQESKIDCLSFVPDADELSSAVKTLKKGVADKERRTVIPTTYINWEEDFEDRIAANFFSTYNWLCLDSITSLSEIIMDRVQYLNGRAGKHPEQADYTAEMSSFRNIVRSLVNLPCNIYVTAHTEILRDETTAKTYSQVILTGRNRVRIPMRFSQIYGLEVDTGRQKGSPYVAYTMQDRMHPLLRTTVKGLSSVVEIPIDFSKNIEGQGLGAFVLKK